MKSYSQRGEDRVISSALAGIERGFYVDVGAGHPMLDSNTASFYERGWTGICVEPNPPMAKQIMTRRPRDITVQAACGLRAQTTTMTVYPAKWGWATIHPGTRGLESHAGEIKRDIKVPVVTLDWVLEKHAKWPGIDFVSIDVEGSEADVLAEFDLARWQPRLICIESVEPGGTKPVYDRWEKALEAFGYECGYDDSVNRFYATNPFILTRLRACRARPQGRRWT